MEREGERTYNKRKTVSISWTSWIMRGDKKRHLTAHIAKIERKNWNNYDNLHFKDGT